MLLRRSILVCVALAAASALPAEPPDAEFAARASKLAGGKDAAAYARFQPGAGKASVKPMQVFLFKDRRTFEDVVNARTGMKAGASANAIYNVKTQTLYLGYLENEDKARSTGDEGLVTVAVHEAIHGLDHLVGDVLTGAPAWMAEGRAEYFCYGLSGRQVFSGRIVMPQDSRKAKVLLDAKDGDAGRLMAAVSLETLEQYALSAAWIHFLMHGEGGKHAQRFHRFVTGRKWTQAEFERAVAPVASLEGPFLRYRQETLAGLIEKK